MTIDDQWAAIARQVPGGWGGVWLVDAQPTIFLVHPDRRDEAVALDLPCDLVTVEATGPAGLH
jgi:hypothetical protein